jgi:hypothetical protein
MTVSQAVPAATAAVEGSTSFGINSAVSIKLIVSTDAKVVRASELSPNFSWRCSSFQSHANTTYSNVSSIGIVLKQRLTGVSGSQLMLPSGAMQNYGINSSNLPPGEYKVCYLATTWYGGSA